MVYVHFTCWELFFFVHIQLSTYRLNFTSPQIAILGSKYPFSLCWGKRTFPFADQENIFQTKHRSPWIFPIASFPWQHTFVIDIFAFVIHFYFTMQLLRAWISRTETVGITFSQHSPADKKKSKDCRSNFAQDQCVILKRTHFAVPPLKTPCQIKIILTFYY